MLEVEGGGKSPLVELQGAFRGENEEGVFVFGAQSRGTQRGWAAVLAQAMQGLECHFKDQSLAQF